ncbi:MAG: AraC family transcriptional regulator [Planctomycetia bacterium]|nr:AraC family transcriptional regulator [Planctomycetia bacterium]
MTNDFKSILHNQLKEMVLKRMPVPGSYDTGIESLTTYRTDEQSSVSNNCFYRPLVALILQGTKRSIIGSEEFLYSENQCLVACIDVPVMSFITSASAEKPFVSIGLELDKYLISQLLVESPDILTVSENETSRGTEVMETDINILGAFLRLIEICDDPTQISVLAPMVIREIHYRLLISPMGHILRSINQSGTPCNQISHAIAWLKENFRKPLQIERLAAQFNMSASHFYRRFKQITTLSPLQYQKRLRLHEAQRLILVEDTDAYHAALNVGYESPTQFSREYKRLFGESPKRDIQRKSQKS